MEARSNGAGGHRAWAVIVANSATYAWRLKLIPHASTDDGVLAFLGLHVRGLFGGHLKSRHVHLLSGTEVQVDAEPTAPVQMDGDLVGTTPLRCVVLPSAISVIVP